MQCLYHLYEEYVQDFLEDNLDRRLSPTELNRMRISLEENQNIHTLIYNIMYIAGKDAIDDSNCRWNSIDEDFKKTRDSFTDLSCKAK